MPMMRLSLRIYGFSKIKSCILVFNMKKMNFVVLVELTTEGTNSSFHTRKIISEYKEKFIFDCVKQFLPTFFNEVRYSV